MNGHMFGRGAHHVLTVGVFFDGTNMDVVLAIPYLAKAGEPVVKVRIGACAITGGFIHLYAALDNRLFDKYGINAEHIVVRGGAVAMAGLASDEINFLYCNADATSCASAREVDAKLVASR